MTGLREMLDEVAEAPAPPSRLVAEDVYAAGRRRRTRRAVLKSVAAAVAVTAAVGVASVVAAPQGGDPPAPADSAAPGPSVTGAIQRAVAADADHLYLAYPACPDRSCAKTTVRLLGSDDGGRTWDERVPAIDVADLMVLGPKTLVATVPRAGAVTTLKISVDGGRTWSEATETTGGVPAQVPAVPDGGAAICWSEDEAQPCTVHALDPASGWFAPLAAQPELYLASGPVEAAAGHLWIGSTSQLMHHQPVVAVSTDAGRTWSTQILPNPSGCTGERCRLVQVATTADGKTAYVVVNDTGAQRRFVYRVTPGGDPKRITGADAVPYDSNGGNNSFVAADGTHLLAEVMPGEGQAVAQAEQEATDGVRWWAADKAGAAYQPVTLDGLPSTVYPVRRTADGWFYTHSYGPDNALYGSTDGWHWSPVNTPGR